eukprot:7044545-Heterocapsa_arctica.AAC.1
MHAEALRDRHERGVPTMLDERDHEDFFARVEKERAEGGEEFVGSNLGEFEGPDTKLGDGGGRTGRC